MTRLGRASQQTRPVRLLPIPGSGQNPYLSLLYGALSRAGVQVLQQAPGLRLGAAQERPDFVHYHWPENAIAHHVPLRQLDRSLWFFARLMAQRRRGAAIIWTFHNAAHHEARWLALHAWARRRMLAHSEIVLVNFAEAREHLAEVYGRHERVWLVPHGSYLGHYPAVGPRSEARSQLGLDEEDLVLMVFGDIRPYKNLETVIAAFKRFDLARARLLIVGGARSAHYGRQIAALCAGDRRIIARLARVADGAVPCYFRAADLLVLAREPFSSGTAVLAYDFGLPLLAPRINHVAELSRGRACLHLADTSELGLLRAFQYAATLDLSLARRDAESSRAPGWDQIACALAEQLAQHLHERTSHG